MILPQGTLFRVNGHQLVVTPLVEVDDQLFLADEGIQVGAAFFQHLLDHSPLALAIVAHCLFNGCHVIQSGLSLGILCGEAPRLTSPSVELGQGGQQAAGRTGRGMAPFEVGVALGLG